MGVKKFLCLLLVLPLLCATGVRAAEIHGRSSTQFVWYDDELNNNKTTLELGEYLRLAVTQIDSAGKINIYGYGRVFQDFTAGNGLSARLYYLYGDIRDLLDKRLDLKIGRQFVNLAAGTAVIDGVQADLKNLGPVPLGFTLLGGHDVRYSLDGEFGDLDDTAFGVATYLALKKPPPFFRNTQAEFSWFRRMHHDEVLADVVGGTITQYLLNNLKLYGNGRYDLATESFNELLAGVKYYPLTNLVFTGEYYQSYPTFDYTSFYSVFAVDQYQQMVLRADYTFSEILSVHGGYNREWFGEGGAANVYLAGLGVRPIAPLLLNAQVEDRTGYYGSITGFILEGIYDFNKEIQLALGMDWDAYQRDQSTGEEIARKYWGGARAKVAKNLAVSARLQSDVNVRFGNNMSGRFVVDYDF